MIPLIAFLAGLTADIVSTVIGVRTPGLREGNPLVSKAQVPLMLGFSLLVIVPAEILRASGQTGWMTGMYYGGAIVHGLAAAWNSYLIARSR